jgi:hypothetical protein
MRPLRLTLTLALLLAATATQVGAAACLSMRVDGGMSDDCGAPPIASTHETYESCSVSQCLASLNGPLPDLTTLTMDEAVEPGPADSVCRPLIGLAISPPQPPPKQL